MSEAGSARLIGTLVADRFRVEKKIAAGGMGVVYLAEQVPLGRPVALKILDTEQLDEERTKNFGERFFREAAAVAKLQHPNTITIHDFGKADGDTYYYAMEYVDGASMSQYVYSQGPLTPGAVIHIGVQVCGSLREAHRAGLIHRDLKPGNIMLAERHDDPFFVKVLDFGLVKVMGDEEIDATELTQSGVLLGSPRYMAPEQILCIDLDERCDVYSLGGVLYHALTGHPPFSHGSQYELLQAQVGERPEPFAKVSSGCTATPRLEALVMRMLEKERRDRPQNMTEVAAELIACAHDIGQEEASLSGAIERISRPGRRDLGSQSGAALSEAASSAREESGEPTEATGQLRPAPNSFDAPAVSPGPVSAEADALRSAESAAARSAELAAALSAELAAVRSAELAALRSGELRAVEPAESAPASSPWRMLAMVAVAAAGLGVLVVGFLGLSGRVGPEPEVAVSEPIQAPEPPVAAPAEPEPVASASVVRIETEPSGARIRHGEEDLGDAPFTFEVPAGERWELEVSLQGHETRTVLASAGRELLHVRLNEIVQAPETRAPRVRPTGGRRQVEPTPPPVEPPVVEPPERQFEDRGDLRHPWARP